MDSIFVLGLEHSAVEQLASPGQRLGEYNFLWGGGASFFFSAPNALYETDARSAHGS